MTVFGPGRFRSRRGVAGLLLSATLALVVLSVLVFSTGYVESTTRSVARSMAWQLADQAADSALREAFLRVTADLNTYGHPSAIAIRTCSLDEGWEPDPLTPELTRRAYAAHRCRIDPVEIRFHRISPFIEPESGARLFRFGQLELSAVVRTLVPGSKSETMRRATRIHEVKISPSMPPRPFQGQPLWIRDFPYPRDRRVVYLDAQASIDSELRRLEQQDAQGLSAAITQLEEHQRVLDSWEERPPHPRFEQVLGAQPRSVIENGLRLSGGTLPLRPEAFEWTEIPEIPRTVPAYCLWTSRRNLTRADLLIEDPARPQFDEIHRGYDPGLAMPVEVPGRPETLVASQVDWPGTQPFVIDGESHYPPASPDYPFQVVIQPYRRYQRAMGSELYRVAGLHDDPWGDYFGLVKFLREKDPEGVPTYDARYWPQLAQQMTRLRAAFVYDDLVDFREVHPPGKLELFGVEMIARNQDVNLEPWTSVRGPGTLAVRGDLRVGPLGALGVSPVTLMSFGNISTSGLVVASLVCPEGKVDFQGSRIQGMVLVKTIHPGTSGDFEIVREPYLPPGTTSEQDLLGEADLSVVNVSPAPVVLAGRRGS